MAEAYLKFRVSTKTEKLPRAHMGLIAGYLRANHAQILTPLGVLSLLAMARTTEHSEQMLGHNGRLPRLQGDDVVNGQVGGRSTCKAPRELLAHLAAQLAPCRVSVGTPPNWAIAFTLALRDNLIGAGLATVAHSLQDAAGQASPGEAQGHLSP
jgi:hypothetical protein